MALFVGDDTKPRHLTGRAGRGIDRHQRQLRLGRAIDAFVITDMPAIGGTQRYTLGAVMGRAATQRHNKVALMLLEHLQARLDVGNARVRLGAVENHRINILQRELLGDQRRNSRLGQPRVGHNQGLAKTIIANRSHGFIQATVTHNVYSRNKESAGHVESSSRVIG